MQSRRTAITKPRSPLAHPEDGDPMREVTFEWLCENIEPIMSKLFDMSQAEVDVKVEHALTEWRDKVANVLENLKSYPKYCGLEKTSTTALLKHIARIEALVRSTKLPRAELAWGSAELVEWDPAARITSTREVGPAAKRVTKSGVAAYVDLAAKVKVVKGFVFQPVPQNIDRRDFATPSEIQVANLIASVVEPPAAAAVRLEVDAWFDIRVRPFQTADLLRELRDLESLNEGAYVAVVTSNEVKPVHQRLLEHAGFGIVARTLGGGYKATSFRPCVPG